MRHAFVSVLFLYTTLAFGQTPPANDPTKLSLDRIFNTDDFKGQSAPNIQWLKNGAHTLLAPSKEIKEGKDIVRIDADGKREILVPATKLIPEKVQKPLVIEGYYFSTDSDIVLLYTNSAKVWRRNTRGDYYTFRRSTGKLVKLGGSAKSSTLMFAKLAPDGKQVGFVNENNIYTQSVDGGPVQQLTSDGSANIINGTFDWVYEEEFDCRDGWRWSEDSNQIAYWQLDTTGVKTFTLVNNTAEKYPVLQTFAYPKTGERNSSCRIGVINIGKRKTTWMAVPGDTKTEYYIPRMEWANNNKELAILRINRLQNTIDVMLANVKTGSIQTIYIDRDGAWLDLHDESLQWLNNNKSFTWISERDGWRQLYTVSRDGSTVKRITNGKHDVIHIVHIDEKSKRIYYIASPKNATQRYLYSASLTGTGEPVRLSPADQPGWHDYNCSPDGTQAIHTYSAFGVSPRINLIALADHKTIRPITENKKLHDTVAKLSQTPVEFFQADAGNGVLLDGYIMKPANFDPKKKYPILFHVYGEPASQTVVDRWGGRNYLWHLMLTQQGYIVASMDNRGTPAPKGRDWRKSVYRKIGTVAAEEQATAVRDLLKKRSYIDPTRVGVWGWSGGGSMTLNLLFRSPDLYKTGLSVAPVPDVHLYDTIYQERYMGLPQDNETDYQKSSPLTHAAGLKGNLLVVHGTGDDNCHYQGVEKLFNKLIELNKPFSMLAYPNRSHSISEGKNTSRHLYESLTRFLHTNLPNN